MQIKIYYSVYRTLKCLPCLLLVIAASCNEAKTDPTETMAANIAKDSTVTFNRTNVLDTVAYNKIISNISNNDSTGKWPATAPYPLTGAVLPFSRIVAFYGNL